MNIHGREKGGKKFAGRKKGVPNKATIARQEAIAASGLTPLEYMLSMMRDEANEPAVRLDAAKFAAPYVHPKLASTDVNVKGSLLLNIDGDLKQVL
jgi:hypothetical protein